MKADKISIIVPVYNVEKYLKRCVDSLITQTYKNIEIILVDDGSTDHSGIMCDQFSEEDSRVVVLHKKNGGLSEARNQGIRKCTGSYILFVDSDDFMVETACEELLRIARKTDADMVSFRESKVNGETGKPLDNDSKETKELIEMSGYEAGRHYLYGKYIQHSSCSKLYQKKMFTNICFPVGLLAEDYATSYRYVGICDKVVYYDRILYFYSIREHSIMTKRSMKLTIDVYKISCKKYEFEKKRYPDDLPIIETSYCNCLLKTRARLYNDRKQYAGDEKKDVEKRLNQINLKLVPLSTKIIYCAYKINLPLFAYLMKILRLNG